MIDVRPKCAAPLDTVTIHVPECTTLVVLDGAGQKFARVTPAGGRIALTVGGALGTHTVLALDADGRLADTGSYTVSARTEMRDGSGTFVRLFRAIFDTFDQWGEGDHSLRINGKRYSYFVSWLRDHVHTLKGMKYFTDEVKTAIELYAEFQREDGMIWDKVKAMLRSERQEWRDHEFAEGDFIRKIPGNPHRRFQRIPVENDVEYLFIEGLYYTWKACGDDEWMKGMLDNAVCAVHYATSDPYRWSEAFCLLKRGYTIDTWDFQHTEDVARSGSAMRVDLSKTVFGVMHGDNTGMAASCHYLAEMLRVAGRGREASEFGELADTLKARLDEVAWNGEFYTHHVSEHPEIARDVGGTDESAQVSQSNAYALNRGLPHDQCTAIIRTYQRLRDEMPGAPAGEFYSIWPPFGNGFRFPPGDYMNGGVTAICAGELARGAFDEGFEEYGADILRRVTGWTDALDGYVRCCLWGVLPEEPVRQFRTVDLRSVVNVDLHGEGGVGVVGWTGEGGNDMGNLPVGRQEFCGIPFDVIGPASNGRRAVLGLSASGPYTTQETVQIGASAASVYFLHCSSGSGFVGQIDVRYADGTDETQYVNTGSEIESWFMPGPDRLFRGKMARPANLRLGWWGPNDVFENVGMFVYGWNNPHPEKEIDSIAFTPSRTAIKWFVAGMTLCDAPVYFEPIRPASSHGIPDNWGAAAVLYALVEGLAGVVDSGVAFDHATVSPRWLAAGENEADICVTYPASGGYVAYRWQADDGGQRIELTGNACEFRIRFLLPAQRDAAQVSVNGQPIAHGMEQIENSRYACVTVGRAQTLSLELVYG